jgi:hypothetical protein
MTVTVLSTKTIIHKLQRKLLRHREVKPFAQDDTVKTWKGQYKYEQADSRSSILSPTYILWGLRKIVLIAPCLSVIKKVTAALAKA